MDSRDRRKFVGEREFPIVSDDGIKIGVAKYLITKIGGMWFLGEEMFATTEQFCEVSNN